MANQRLEEIKEQGFISSLKELMSLAYSKDRILMDWIKFLPYSALIKSPLITAGALSLLEVFNKNEAAVLDLFKSTPELVNMDLLARITAINTGLLILADMLNFKAEDTPGKIINGGVTFAVVGVLFLAQMPLVPEPNTVAQAELASKLPLSMTLLLLHSLGLRAIIAPLVERLAKLMTHKEEFPTNEELLDGRKVPHFHKHDGTCDGNCMPRGTESTILGPKLWSCEKEWHLPGDVALEGDENFVSSDQAAKLYSGSKNGFWRKNN